MISVKTKKQNYEEFELIDRVLVNKTGILNKVISN